MGTSDPEGGKASCVCAVGDNEQKACFAALDGDGGGVKVVHWASLDSQPEAAHASERGGVQGREVGPVDEYGEEVATGTTALPWHRKGLTPAPGEDSG